MKNTFCTQKHNPKKESLDYLLAAKKVGNKKAFRDFLNSEIVKGYVPHIVKNSESKVVDNIMEFAGADFGNKLYHKKREAL